MLYPIGNDQLTLQVESRGAEMQSIRSAQGTQYLWQGDPRSWPDRAPNLFPWIARLTQGKYTHKGKSYFMDSHGFAAASEFTVQQIAPTALVCTLQENSETLRAYPFPFVLHIGYRLVGTCIRITFCVKNPGAETLYFGLGGHPGFVLPLGEGTTFSDYALAFSKPCRPLRVDMSQDCFVTGTNTPFLLKNDDTLPLAQSLFDNDAIILRDMTDEVSVCGPTGRCLTLRYPGFPYLGLWNWPKKDVNYLCIEPWTALPARKDVVEELGEKPDFFALAPGETLTRNWEIEIYP